MFVASITHRAELYALAVVDLVDGRAVRSLYRNALFEGEERYVWEEEKVRAIVSRETQIAQANTVSLEAWRASYLPDGRLESLVYADPSLSTCGETLIIEESVNLEGENGDCWDVGDEHEWSRGCG